MILSTKTMKQTRRLYFCWLSVIKLAKLSNLSKNLWCLSKRHLFLQNCWVVISPADIIHPSHNSMRWKRVKCICTVIVRTSQHFKSIYPATSVRGPYSVCTLSYSKLNTYCRIILRETRRELSFVVILPLTSTEKLLTRTGI